MTLGGSGAIGAAREVAGMTAKVNAATAIARIARLIVILPASWQRPDCLLNDGVYCVAGVAGDFSRIESLFSMDSTSARCFMI